MPVSWLLLNAFNGEWRVATGFAAQKTREPITLMVPLVWLAATRHSHPTITESEVPVAKIVDDAPMYALDKHTRLWPGSDPALRVEER